MFTYSIIHYLVQVYSEHMINYYIMVKRIEKVRNEPFTQLQ
jgi:hypothetical protein